MYYAVVPQLNLIFAWSPKCACTTVKSAVLLALGHSISGNVHNEMLTTENLKSGKYGIYSLHSYRQIDAGFKPKKYRKVCIIRNPYSRFVSAIRQRSRALSEDTRFGHMTPKNYLEYLEQNNFGEDHHFHPQTKNLKSFSFDRVLDIGEMGGFFEMIGLAYEGNRYGKHTTSYGSERISLQDASLRDITGMKSFPEKIQSWLDEEGQCKLRQLYAPDFDFGLRHGRDYDLPAGGQPLDGK